MSDTYPHEQSLRIIRGWPHDDHLGLMDFVESLWRYADWGFTRNATMVGDVEFFLSTGGWSGNEEIISALQENKMFWALCWKSSWRGGHYQFKLRKRRDEEN